MIGEIAIGTIIASFLMLFFCGIFLLIKKAIDISKRTEFILFSIYCFLIALDSFYQAYLGTVNIFITISIIAMLGMFILVDWHDLK